MPLSHYFRTLKGRVNFLFPVFTISFMKHNINFGLLSLNARGIRTFEKRKALFQWLNKDKADIIFLQETYSTVDVENI